MLQWVSWTVPVCGLSDALTFRKLPGQAVTIIVGNMNRRTKLYLQEMARALLVLGILILVLIMGPKLF